LKELAVLAFLPALALGLPGVGRAQMVVSQDGLGDVRTIQEALDAVPRENTRTVLILIRNGTYREKLYIRSSHVALVGEDRERTRIVFAELRRNWRATHDSDWGAAVVNVGDDVTDLFIGNLTVLNDYGAATGDHDHQFAIRSGGSSNRIVLVHANVVADGGDTLSLWNADSGMSYHADCAFEGWVDFVCPRGTCYVTGSRFFAHSPTAAIWHDGSRNREMKFVIRRSSFDGVPGFPLGRNNRDGQFFLLDARFSRNMADRPIYRPSAERAYRWPPRAYYWSCSREGGDFAWFADNLGAADGWPWARDVTARWTFQGRWDPEDSIPPVLPFASVPRPEAGDEEVPPCGTVLRWAGARDATAYRVSFGLGPVPPFRATVDLPHFDPGPLAPSTAYAWRVDVVEPTGLVEGPVWTFRTAPPPVRVALVGDSTVTDEIGWGLGFRERLSERAECFNLARNGRSSKSYRAEGFWDEALALGPDVVLIQFGHNDQPGKGPDRETDPATTFRANLSRYVDEARAAGAVPVLVTPLARRIYLGDGTLRPDLEVWAAVVREVAAQMGVPLVDLYAQSRRLLVEIGPSASVELGIRRPDGTVDKTHLSRNGSSVFGSMVAGGLRRAVPALSAEVR
jgi:lysophospholipase L1-like esterase